MNFLLSSILIAQISASVFNFDSTDYSNGEWKTIFKEATRRIEEGTGVKIKIERWRKTKPRCHNYFFSRYADFARCYTRRVIVPDHDRRRIKGITAALGGAVRASKGSDTTYVTGVANRYGSCDLYSAIALVSGKRNSTHFFSDGNNAGYEMTIVALQHELMHLLSAIHDDDINTQLVGGVMDSDALFFVVNEWPSALPYPQVSWHAKSAVRSCLANSGVKL